MGGGGGVGDTFLCATLRQIVEGTFSAVSTPCSGEKRLFFCILNYFSECFDVYLYMMYVNI